MPAPTPDCFPVFVPGDVTLLGQSGPEAVPQRLLRQRIDHAARVAVDLGTGDGRWILRRARSNPDGLAIGIDVNADAMTKSARRARAKPSRGGVPNALFVVAAFERLPEALSAAATDVYAQYPWGSLLRFLAWPLPGGVGLLRALIRPGGRLTLLLNANASDDPEYASRHELPPLDDRHVHERLLPALETGGFVIEDAHRLDGDFGSEHTSWGRRLVAGSRRETLAIKASADLGPT